MQTPEDLKKTTDPKENPSTDNREKQQQSDPQLTELKGFVDKDEKLEPEIYDDNAGKDKSNK